MLKISSTASSLLYPCCTSRRMVASSSFSSESYMFTPNSSSCWDSSNPICSASQEDMRSRGCLLRELSCCGCIPSGTCWRLSGPAEAFICAGVEGFPSVNDGRCVAPFVSGTISCCTCPCPSSLLRVEESPPTRLLLLFSVRLELDTLLSASEVWDVNTWGKKEDCLPKMVLIEPLKLSPLLNSSP